MLQRLSPTQSPRDLPPGRLVLWETGEGLCLAMTGPQAPHPIRVDFGAGRLAFRRSRGGSEALVKAVRGSQKGTLRVLDATGGLGTDAFLLACHGMKVTMLEKDPNLCLLLQDGLERAKALPHLKNILEGLHLVQTDSLVFLEELPPGRFDVVYLDPMFPERGGAALPGKEMQILRRLLSDPPPPDEEKVLLERARRAVKRVVVKRPKNAPPLGGIPAPFQRMEKRCRFDLYVS